MIDLLVRNLTNLMFPKTSDVSSIDHLYLPQTYDRTIYLLPYGEPAVQQLIKSNKYQRDTQAANALAKVAQRYIGRFDQPVTIVPVPQSYRRWRERGFDHLAEIIKHTNVQSTTSPLRKTKHTKRQAHVSKPERLVQQAGSFSCDAKLANKIHGTVLLFDDVVTTGATMNAARSVLVPHLNRDTKIICLALAH